MNPFRFELHQMVAITASGESGEIVGRAEYTNSSNSYYIRYKAADGTAVTKWWEEDALTEAE